MRAHVPSVAASPPKAKPAPRQSAVAHTKTGSEKAREEIQTYVAIRDLLLHDAEVITTAESLRRAGTANDFLETCLQPPRSPYEAQSLCRIDAVRERARCQEARNRIADLRHKLQRA